MNKKEEKKKDARYDPTLTAEERKNARKLTENQTYDHQEHRKHIQ